MKAKVAVVLPLIILAVIFLSASNIQGPTLPTQTGNAGKFLQTDGTNPLWAAPVLTGAQASRPAAAAGNTGQLYLPNNGFYASRSTGSAYATFGPWFPFTEPDNTAFSDLNGPTVVTTNGGIVISTAASGTDQNRARVKAVPGATPYTVDIAILPRFIVENFHNAGLYVTDGTNAATSKLWGCYVGGISGQSTIKVDKWTNSTTFSANAVSLQLPVAGVIFLRYADDSTNRSCSYSFDGVNYEAIFSEGRTTFLTATHIGFGVQTANATRGTLMTLVSYNTF